MAPQNGIDDGLFRSLLSTGLLENKPPRSGAKVSDVNGPWVLSL
jgi:hypothetical protein